MNRLAKVAVAGSVTGLLLLLVLGTAKQVPFQPPAQPPMPPLPPAPPAPPVQPPTPPPALGLFANLPDGAVVTVHIIGGDSAGWRIVDMAPPGIPLDTSNVLPLDKLLPQDIKLWRYNAVKDGAFLPDSLATHMPFDESVVVKVEKLP